jgi:cyanate permease
VRETFVALIVFVLGLLVIFVGVPVGAFVLLYIKRKEWGMKVRRLLGGFLVAVVIAFALSATAQAVYIRCEWDGWNFCWPF